MRALVSQHLLRAGGLGCAAALAKVCGMKLQHLNSPQTSSILSGRLATSSQPPHTPAPSNQTSSDSITVKLFGQTFKSSGETLEAPGRTVNTAGQTGNTSGQTVNTSGQPVNTAGQTVSTAGQTVNTTGQTVKIVGQTVNTAGQTVKVDFSNAQGAYAQRSTRDLLRAYAVFSACTVQPLVANADTLLSLSNKVLGHSLTRRLVKATFFDHFCAGEDAESIRPTIDFLRSCGVGSILDYAAEDDVQDSKGPQSRQADRAGAVARTYDYESETKCNRHAQTFLQAIRTVASLPGANFAAVKATALGPPALLQQMSCSLLAIRQLFQRFDANGDGFISPKEFNTAYQELFPGSSQDEVQHHFNRIATRNGGHIDYVSWLQRVKLKHTPGIAARLREQGTSAGSWQREVEQRCLDDAELALTEAMMERLRLLTQTAADTDVRLMIDAEYTYLQPAIDHAAVELMRQFNKERPVVFNTYQCYLKDSKQRLLSDMERAQREGYIFAAKLVRGAYLQLERNRAMQMGYPDPIWPTIEDTHQNYDECVKAVLSRVSRGDAEVVVASHNTSSVESTVSAMEALGLEPKRAGVYFGQLLGMADHLTFNLGRHGYKSYKYVPYGPVEEVMPYLIRRAQENNAVLSGARQEMRMIRGELVRRLKGAMEFK